MSDLTIGAALRWLARREPGALAVREVDPATGSARSLTRAQLHAASVRLAARWAGAVGRDDLVAIAPATGTEVLVAAAAAWVLGAVPLPLPADQEPRERAGVLAAARAALVVEAVDVDALLADPDELPQLPDAAAGAWKAATSGGSTGAPKVVLSARPGTVDPQRPAVGFVPATGVQLVPAALHHAASFTYAARGLMAGQPLVLLRSPGPGDVLAALAVHRASWVLLSPTAMLAIWRLGPAGREGPDLSALERVVHLGAPCPAWLKRAWIDWLGPERVVEVYASTESHVVTVIDGREWLAHPGSVGRARSGAFRVLDDDGHDVPAGVVGQVWVMPAGGPGSTYRYLGAHPAAPSREGWETLGDLGWLEEGGWLHLVDRAGDVVPTAAGPVHPAAVEEVLSEHPAVRSVVVAGTSGMSEQDEHGGPVEHAGHQRLHAVVDVADAGVTGEELTAWARERLPAQAVPASIDVVHAPVRDAAGKARRRDAAATAGGLSPEAPRPGS